MAFLDSIIKTNRPKESFINNLVNNTKPKTPVNTTQTKYPMSTFSNTSATNPTVPVISKPTTTTQSKSSTDKYGQVLGDNSPSAVAARNTAINSPSGQQFVNSLTSQSTTQPNQQTGTTTTSTVEKPKTAYDKYIESLNSKENKGYLDKKTSDAQRLADIQGKSEQVSKDARKGYNAILDSSGGLKSGAEQSAQVYNRRSSDDLADLALQESAAARTAGVSRDAYNDAIAQGKTAYEAELAQQEADTEASQYQDTLKQRTFENDLATQKFEEDKRQFGAKYALSQRKASGSGAGTGLGGQLSSLAQAVQNGTISLDKLTPTERGKVAAELSSFGAPSTRQQTLTANLDVVNSLINNPNKNKISGFIQGKFGLGNLNPNAQLALNQFNQLKGILSLENREKLKGSGAISDFEFKVLSDAATALGRNLDDDDFNTQLSNISDVFAGKYANTRLGSESGSSSGASDPLGIR